jgi:uncharacterized repeat protein (TIGR03943 family)
MRPARQLPLLQDAPRLVRPPKTWSPQRIAGALILSAWAAMFWFVLFSGRSALYLGPRTQWLIPVGAVILSIGAAGRVVVARSSAPETFDRRVSARIVLLLLPILVVVALPPASLGAYALGRRTNLIGSGFAGTGNVSSGPVTLGDVALGLASPVAMRSLVARAGTRVSFVGFVSRGPGTPADEFELTRFVITCCVADALSVQVRVVDAPPGRFASDEWVRVSGRLYPLRGEVLLAASSVSPVARPEHPYLSP